MMLECDMSIVFADHVGSNAREVIARDVLNHFRINFIKKNGRISAYWGGAVQRKFDFLLGVPQQNTLDQQYRRIDPIFGGVAMTVGGLAKAGPTNGFYPQHVITWRTKRPGAAKLPVTLAEVMGELRSALSSRDGEAARHVLVDWASRVAPGDDVISGLLEHVSSHLRHDSSLMDTWPVEWLSTLREGDAGARWQSSSLPVKSDVPDDAAGILDDLAAALRDGKELNASLGVRPWLTSRFELNSPVEAVKVLIKEYLTLARGLALQDESAVFNSDAAAKGFERCLSLPLNSDQDLEALRSAARNAANSAVASLRLALWDTIPLMGTNAAIIKLINRQPAYAAHFAEFGFDNWYSQENDEDGTQPRARRVLSLADYVEADHFSIQIQRLYARLGSSIIRNARSMCKESQNV